MSIKVIRQKQVTPPVEKVVVELTPDQAKLIFGMVGGVNHGDEIRKVSDSLYGLFSQLFIDPVYSFCSPYAVTYAVSLKMCKFDDVFSQLKFRDDV